MHFRAKYSMLFPIFVVSVSIAMGQKTYKHASEYKVAVLDETIRLHTGTDLTSSRTSTDSKLDQGGQGMHFLHTESGDYRVEAPVNKGASFLAAMATPKYQTAPTVHNKWFLDKVQPNTQVLFASNCSKPSKNHPHDVVRCVFWFPDPDSENHEYVTTGDFTPYIVGDGANTAKVAASLCGTGKLNPDTEAKLCVAIQKSAVQASTTETPSQK